MSRFVIEGRHALSGTFRPAGNKNAALPMLAACLLTDEPVMLGNIPDIEDVRVMLEILTALGAEVSCEGGTVRVNAAGVSSTEPPDALCRRVRASILLAGPLVARHGKAVLPPPGGDGIGRRRLDTHVSGMRELGIEVESDPAFTFTRRALRGTDLLLDEASVTATENIVMAACLAEGETTIYHAACEPHVVDLCDLLNAMGARIAGHGTNRIQVQGVSRLGGAEHRIAADYVEVGSFIAAAAATGGSLTIEDLGTCHAERVLARGFQKVGVGWSVLEDRLNYGGGSGLVVQDELGSAIPKIEDGIWPAFPSDMMSVAIVVATQAEGTILFFEKLFESRMYFVDRLIEMGARIVQCDPHRAVVQGPCHLHGTHMTSPDIRAGMAMVVAALAADGVSVIENAQMIDRGYERIDERLRALGAAIDREE